MHNKPVADNPLSLAEVTGFMAMEVKLQSSLTEQNAKFIKVCFCFLCPVCCLQIILYSYDYFVVSFQSGESKRALRQLSSARQWVKLMQH